MILQPFDIDPTQTHTDEHGALRPLTDLHQWGLVAMRRTATTKQLTLTSYAPGNRLLLSEALDLLRDLAKPNCGRREPSTVAREAFGLLCMHGEVFTDGTTVWLLGDTH